MSFSSTPFRSYSSEHLNLFGRNDGSLAGENRTKLCNFSEVNPFALSVSRSALGSQPRTPVSEYGRSNSSWHVPGKSLSLGSGNLGPNLGSVSVTPGGSGAGGGGGGRTVKEYDEGFRELKKENFNLKLRIYFLEERLGAGSQVNLNSTENDLDSMAAGSGATPKKGHGGGGGGGGDHSNMDLKVSTEFKSFEMGG